MTDRETPAGVRWLATVPVAMFDEPSDALERFLTERIAEAIAAREQPADRRP